MQFGEAALQTPISRIRVANTDYFWGCFKALFIGILDNRFKELGSFCKWDYI